RPARARTLRTLFSNGRFIEMTDTYDPALADKLIRFETKRAKTKTNGDAHDTRECLRWIDMFTWDRDPIPERKWAIRDRVPLNQAGLFSGEGGTGKSIVELTKDVAHVTGKDWFGSMPETGPAIYICAEDDEDEIHIRLANIASHYGVTFEQLIAGGLHVL